MGARIDITAPGLEDLIRIYHTSPTVVGQEMMVAMHKSVLHLRGSAQQEAPVGVNGNLRDQIYESIEGTLPDIVGKVQVHVGVGYQVPVHEGSDPHWIPMAGMHNLCEWARVKLGDYNLGYILRYHIAHHGTRPNMFFDRVAVAEQARVDLYWAQALANVRGRLGIP